MVAAHKRATQQQERAHAVQNMIWSAKVVYSTIAFTIMADATMFARQMLEHAAVSPSMILPPMAAHVCTTTAIPTTVAAPTPALHILAFARALRDTILDAMA